MLFVRPLGRDLTSLDVRPRAVVAEEAERVVLTVRVDLADGAADSRELLGRHDGEAGAAQDRDEAARGVVHEHARFGPGLLHVGVDLPVGDVELDVERAPVIEDVDALDGSDVERPVVQTDILRDVVDDDAPVVAGRRRGGLGGGVGQGGRQRQLDVGRNAGRQGDHRENRDSQDANDQLVPFGTEGGVG